MNIRIGKISKIISPSYSYCWKCHTTWNFVKHHITMYNDGNGIFPLCEKCWNELSEEERVPYYRNLYMSRSNKKDETWKKIEQAVLAGK